MVIHAIQPPGNFIRQNYVLIIYISYVEGVKFGKLSVNMVNINYKSP